MTTTESLQDPPRSTFVTVVAWVFIVLAGFATLITVLQNIMINVAFPVDQIPKSAELAKNVPAMPPFFRFMFDNIRLIFLFFMLLSATTLASSIGLLARKNWARLAFVGLMVFGIAWNVLGVLLQQWIFSTMPKMPEHVPAHDRAGFEMVANVMLIVSIVMAVGFSLLFGWIAKRLMSPTVRSEFSRP